MGVMSELAYEIESLYIEGFSPKSIALQLGCDLDVVYDWLDENSVGSGKEDVKYDLDPDILDAIDEYYGA